MSKPGSPRIRVAISDPKLKDKIQINLQGPVDIVYWQIRFNIPLDESSVNEKSMEVTDTEGYVMRTDISYRSKENKIIISPLDSYEDRRYYLLKISRKVRSARGQNLKTVISILFKLYQGSISEYKILRKDVPVPKSKPRPSNYETMQQKRAPNFLDKYVDNLPNRTTMENDTLGVKIWLGLLGLVLAAVGFVMGNIPLIIAAMVTCALGAAHIYIQWQNRAFRAKVYYNRGVRYFNRMQYQEAKTAFEKAAKTDPSNQLAKYGLVRVGLYK